MNSFCNTILIILFSFAITACGKSDWYQAAQFSQTTECRNGPISEYDRCMEAADKTYNEYEKDREVLFK